MKNFAVFYTFIIIVNIFCPISFAQDSSPETESVVVEGVGKTEASAKKSAYKEAVAKVVGVLVDSSTLVKNDKIISEELLEYSGGFVTKAEVLSTKKDDEGLVRVKVRCVVEKAHVKKKLQSINITVIKVDGVSLAAKEMTLEEMRKNATALFDKSLIERRKLYTTTLPPNLSSVKKGADGQFLIPVKVHLDSDQLRKWNSNWLPVFEKIAVKSGSIHSKYIALFSERSCLKLPRDQGHTFCDVPAGDLSAVVDMSEFWLILIPEFIGLDHDVKWKWFSIALAPEKLSQINIEAKKKISLKERMEFSSHAKLSIELTDTNKNIFHYSETKLFGVFDSLQHNAKVITDKDPFDNFDQSPINIVKMFDFHSNTNIKIMFCPPFPVQREGYSYFFSPDKTGSIFEVKVQAADLARITKLTSRLEWIEPIK